MVLDDLPDYHQVKLMFAVDHERLAFLPKQDSTGRFSERERELLYGQPVNLPPFRARPLL